MQNFCILWFFFIIWGFMEYSEKLKRLREQHQLTQEEMAEMMNISPNAYGYLERGKTKITLERLQQIAHIFNVKIDDLIHDDRNIICVIGDNIVNGGSNNHYENHLSKIDSVENEKLKIIIEHQNKEIELLKSLILSLQEQIQSLKGIK